MSNLITRTTELAMSVTLTYINPGDTVVDATCGTGQDTVVLARAVGSAGSVYAFDIQKNAHLLTEARLKSHGFTNVHLVMQSFVSMSEHIPERSAAAVVFNLGYLPGGDHSITTTADTTLKGLECALKTIRPGGIVTVVMYDGHNEGAEEKAAVLEWAEALDQSRYHVAYVSLLNQKNHPPEILWITRK
ncbi:MAG: methyltransferase domain-containing protein [Mogibacterium sp.]|nr:methyltransferase domain-containing protein [Mogibacterium sp.]